MVGRGTRVEVTYRENVICKDPTIGYDFFLSRGVITKSEIFKKHPYWGKMTTRGNLATLVLIITLGCSHAYVGRIINAKIFLGIMI